MKKILNKKLFIIFTLFFAFLLIQNHFLWLFHDDYGYVSLSYLPQFDGNRGLNTSFLDIFNFLFYHYQNWGGRVLYFFLEIILLRLGLPAYRIFQSIITLGIFVLIFKIIKKKIGIDDYRISLFCILCYGVFEILVFRASIFWITASVLYFIPLFPFLLFVYLYDSSNKSKIRNILCSILIFISSWSQEQIAVLVLVYIFLYTLHDWIILKNKNKNDIIMCFCSLLGFLILYLSNGSMVRMERYPSFYDMPFFIRILKNIPNILLNNFGYYTKIFSFLFFLCGLYVINENKKSTKFKRINSWSFLSTLIIIVLTALFERGYFSYMYEFSSNTIYKALILCLLMCQLFIVFLNIIYYFYKQKQYAIAYLFIGAILSQVSMLVSPYFPSRSVIMFELPCFIIFAYIFSEIIKSKRIDINIILVPMIVVCMFNMVRITYGYYVNDDEHRYNHSILLETSDKIKNGEKIKSIRLKKIQNRLYGIEQPYDDGYDYIAYYMRFYYEIPNNVEFIYE